MTNMQVGIIRLAQLWSVGGGKARVLYLPVPSKDGLSLEWEQKATSKDLINGSPRTRVLGYVPVLTCKWSAYDDRPWNGYVIGTNDGCRPDLESLLIVLSQPTGMLAISPGPSAGGFVVDSVNVSGLGKAGQFYTGLQVVFRGRDIAPEMALGPF